MIDVFLSASVPLPDRNRKFFETADVFLIREAIRALIEVVLPYGRITFGGHPAITPLMSLYSKSLKLERERITIYQSEYFRGLMPKENKDFADIRYTPKISDDLNHNIGLMREEMLKSRDFNSAVLIGGMEGIRAEADMFRRLHPNALILPVAATGAAARLVFQEDNYPRELADDISFASLFRRKLLPKPEIRKP